MTDQLLLAPNSDYSGSYTDRIIFNSPAIKLNSRNIEKMPEMYGPLTDGTTIGFWSLDGDIADSSGNGLDLELLTGSLEYVTGAIDTVEAIFFSGSNLLTQTSSLVTLSGLDKNMTLEFMYRPLSPVSGTIAILDDFPRKVPIVCMGSSSISLVTDGHRSPYVFTENPWSTPGALKYMQSATFWDADGTVQINELAEDINYFTTGNTQAVTMMNLPHTRQRPQSAEITSSNYAELNGVWSHCVLTVTRSSTSDPYEMNFYVNGQSFSSSSQEAVSSSYLTWGSETQLYIGGAIIGGYSAGGILATITSTIVIITDIIIMGTHNDHFLAK